MKLNARLLVVILAAGLSRRLGYPKQWVTQAGEPLFLRTVKLALSLRKSSPPPYDPAVSVYVVVPAIAERWAVAMTQHLAGLPVTLIANDRPADGMGYSIGLAVPQLASIAQAGDRVLLLTLDQLALSQAHLLQLTKPLNADELWVSRYSSLGTYPNALDNCRPILGVPANMPWQFFAEFGKNLPPERGFGSVWRQQTQVISSTGKHYQLYPLDLPALAIDLDTKAAFYQLAGQFELGFTDLAAL